mmetsp:Transcript_100192/g.251193  ORF Transcript_100192/g.251193 Transcript_100192/m.251193 type:complete len:392 (+) Transcript_100192:75-1250(+)
MPWKHVSKACVPTIRTRRFNFKQFRAPCSSSDGTPKCCGRVRSPLQPNRNEAEEGDNKIDGNRTGKHDKRKGSVPRRSSNPGIWPLCQTRDDRVQGLARVHRAVRLGPVHVVVAAQVHRLALAIDQILQDLALAVLQLCRGRGKGLLQRRVRALLCQLLSPIASHPVVAAAIVNLLHLARRVLVGHQEGAHGLVQRAGQDLGLRVTLAEVLERAGQRQVLAQGVPAQVALFLKLLHVLGRGAAGAGLVHAAARQHRHDGEHLGRGAQLQNRPEVGEVVPQHVARDGDGVQSLLGARARHARGLQRRHDLDVQAGGVEQGQVLLYLLHEDYVMGTGRVQPEDRLARSAVVGELVRPAPPHRQLHPILDWRILRLARAVDVSGLDFVSHEDPV